MRISDWSSDVCSSDLPSGQRRRIDYAVGDDGRAAPPVLAVKLQELFGLADTPRIADGRVALPVHLLSPAGRPLQVTRDLRSFWENTYPEVRRAMKGRYPNHTSPELGRESCRERVCPDVSISVGPVP